MKTALVCATIGQTRRGYERYFSELFAQLRSHVDITLFKGGGKPAPREKVVAHLSRTGILSRVFPDRFLYARYLLEFGTFGAGLVPRLAAGNFDLVHFIDPPLARTLHTGRKLTGGRYRLVFSNARPWSFDCSRWADHIHCINPSAFDEARQSGLGANRLSMIPIGLDSAGLECRESRDELRRRYGVEPGQRVVLSVTSLNREHKRVDYLIEEAAATGGNMLLWLDGSLHPDGDPGLLKLGAEKLGNRFRHTHVPSDRVGELYRLADLFVSSAMTESFGMAIVEAMRCGLPVIVHDSPHFRWLTDGGARFVNMAVAGNLTACLHDAMQPAASPADPAALAAAAGRFEWSNITRDYLHMYERALGSPQVQERSDWAAGYDG
jgi:glycosyltransferase involved in cell wall biosynthesis